MAEMIDTRSPREQSTRAKEARKKVTFVPSGLLPELENPDPDYVYRWVRVSVRGNTDTINVSNRLRGGWVPVKEEEFPGLALFPYDPTARFPGMIIFGGHLLCKISREHSDARRSYYDEMSRRQMESVDNDFMRENDRRMPLFRERKTQRLPFG